VSGLDLPAFVKNRSGAAAVLPRSLCTFCTSVHCLLFLWCTVQSIQSPRLSVQSSELGPLRVQGGKHTRLRGGGEGPNSDDGTGTLVTGIYVYYNLSTFTQAEKKGERTRVEGVRSMGPMYFVFCRLYSSPPSHYGSVWVLPNVAEG
jgi:hypothetical protein